MATLFFSYSHKDEELRNELEVHLAMLKRSGAIEAWHDRKIPAGDELDRVIDARMELADVILLLVSPDFLASRYCYDIEVARAMERHREGTVRVIPVILRPCDWEQAPFAKLLVTPTDGKPVTKWPSRDDAFLDVVKQIRAALSAKAPATASPPRYPAPVIAAAAGAAAGTVAPVPGHLPRSSNLRVKKNFTEADRDRFLEETFEFMARFFEGSLEELEKRHPGLETKFKRIDAHSFSAIIYRHGEAVSRCSIRHGGNSSFSGITYSFDDKASPNTCNEALNLTEGEQSLGLKPMGMSWLVQGMAGGSPFSQEGAAELYWAMLIDPLQR